MTEAAKVIRRQKKAAVTRHLGTLERLVAEEDAVGVQSKLDQVHTSFLDLETSHEVYHNLLEDEAEIEQSDSWFNDVQSIYIVKIKAARSWLKSQKLEAKQETDSDLECDSAMSPAD